MGVEMGGLAIGMDDGPPVVVFDGAIPVFGAKVELERIASIANATAIPIPIPTIDFFFKF